LHNQNTKVACGATRSSRLNKSALVRMRLAQAWKNCHSTSSTSFDIRDAISIQTCLHMVWNGKPNINLYDTSSYIFGPYIRHTEICVWFGTGLRPVREAQPPASTLGFGRFSASNSNLWAKNSTNTQTWFSVDEPKQAVNTHTWAT
jgi:hypothetical protein